MRALLRTVTGGGSPRPRKANAPRYTVSDVVAAWAAVKGTLEHDQSGKDAAAAQAQKKGRQSLQDEQATLTSLTKNITLLVDALVSEASVYAFEESTGPCFEYLLTNDVLTTLVALALPDRPAGLLGVLIKAFDTLVALLGDDFVALASRPLSRLLKGCFEAPARPAEQHDLSKAHVKDGSDGSTATASSTGMDRLPSSNYRADAYDAQLAGLLCGICSRIKAHPDLLPIFLERRTAGNSSTGTDKGSQSPAKVLTVLRSPTSSSRSTATRSSSEVPDDSSASLATTSPPSAGRSTDIPHKASAHLEPAAYASSVEILATGYKLPLLAYLLKYLHRDGRAGEFARAGVLFLVDLAVSPLSGDTSQTREAQRQRGNGSPASPSAGKGKPDPRPTLGRRAFSASSSRSTSRLSVNGESAPLTRILASYLASSDLADVLGAGLGALYGLLPAKLHIPARPHGAGFGLVKPEAGLQSAGAADTSDVFDAATQDALDAEERLEALRDDGYAILGDADFTEQLKGWSKLVEFGQDMVRRAQSNVDGHALAERSLASIRTAFLENAFLPCMLECQHIPSHLAAVLLHVEVLLDILEPEGGLADCVLSFLLDTPAPFELAPTPASARTGTQPRPEQSMTTPSRPTGSIAMDRLASSSHSRATSISDSGKSRLLLLSDGRHGAGSADMSLSSSHLSAPGSTSRARATTPTRQRLAFTLRDMLDRALTASGQPAIARDGDIQKEGELSPSAAEESGVAVADLALRIIHLLLFKFDYWGTELLRGVLALGATRFPFDTSASSSTLPNMEGVQDDEEETFVYPSSDDDGASTTDSFVYPEGPGAPPPSTPAAETKAALDGQPRPSGPSELEMLLQLTSTSKEDGEAGSPSAAVFDILGIGAAASTGYESYLLDAEAAVLRDPSFRRGLSIASSVEHLEEAGNDYAAQGVFSPPLLSPPEASTSTGSFFAVPTSRPSGQGPAVDRMSQHYVHSPLWTSPDLSDIPSQVSILLQTLRLFARYFANPPETNLALSAIWSAMASCPYRSLQGWLLPSTYPLSRLAEASLIPVSPAAELATKSSDMPALRPFEIFQLALQGGTDSATENVLSFEEAAVFAILERLIGQVERYRRDVQAFDKHLSERRDVLLFIDDLAEAIGSGAPNGEPPRPSFTASRSSSNLATASPLKRPPGAGVSTTPVRVKKGSKGSLLASRHEAAQKSEQAVLSPYASHYAQTSEMRVKAWVVPLPADAQSQADPVTLGWSRSSTLASIASHRFDGGPETPTRQSTFARPGKRAAMLGTSDRSGDASPRMGIDAVEISLSQLLDNVIILEEMVKELVALVVVRKRLGIDEV